MPSPAIFRTLSAGLSTGLSTGLSDARAASPSHASTPQAIPRRSQSVILRFSYVFVVICS